LRAADDVLESRIFETLRYNVPKCTAGTNHVPPHLEFLNYPDSSMMSSFPNTPHDSGENSASSGTSVADATEESTVKKQGPMTRSPFVTAALKRRLRGTESPAKVMISYIVCIFG